MKARSALRWLFAALTTALASAQQVASTAPADWAFRPLTIVAPPAVADATWMQNPVDRFVRARLDANGIAPSAIADRHTLLRRATFVLTGLPPTDAEMQAFLADAGDDAWPRAVDRLLSSPHYGEHQARHWLDLARYSDSNGLDENLAFANAFRYRDWVVAAHNQDLPFDRFLAMQIAGDLLVDDPHVGLDGYVATGFLAMGPRMLAEQDKEKLLLDTIDEQLDLVGRTFLGLTIGCARCHDHKFDPIPTADYYAMAGIFRSTKSFRELGHVSQWFDRELASDAAIAARRLAEARRDEAERQLAAATSEAITALRRQLIASAQSYLLAGQSLLLQSHYVEAEAANATSLRRDDSQWGATDCVVLHTNRAGPQFAEYHIDVTTARRHSLAVRFAAVESRPMRIVVDGRTVVERTLTETTGGWLPAQQAWHDAGEFELAAGAHVLRLEALGPHVPHLDALMLMPADTSLIVGDLLPPVVRQVASVLAQPSEPPLLHCWRQLAQLDGRPEFAATAATMQGQGGLTAMLLAGAPPASLTELAGRYQVLFDRAADAIATLTSGPANPALDDPQFEAVRVLFLDRGGLFALPETALRPWLPATVGAELTRLEEQFTELKQNVPAAAPSAMSVADDRVHELPIHLRGSHLTLAKEATPRGFLSELAAHVPAPALPANASGRRELAAWLTAPSQPLTPRVLANRIWQRAFGDGLVRSPSNFGRRGDVPLHVELLDWLADDLRQHGWSQKHLWRRLLLSQTWQQTSTLRPDVLLIDAENRLIWRQQRQRLSAESVRDAMLAVSQQLDRTLGGTLLTTDDRGYVTNDQSSDQARYDAPRRSLYLPIIRNAMFDLFCAFDYVDPSVHLEQRPQSAIATQALYLLNAPFVREQSAALAARVPKAADDDAAITFLWWQALTRSPSTEEVAFARRWFATARAAGEGEHALSSLAQALFASNEFLYID